MDDKAYYEFISLCVELLSAFRGTLHDLLMIEGHLVSPNADILALRRHIESCILSTAMLIEATQMRRG